MSSPAHLLLIERLIAVFLALVEAFDRATETHGFDLRRAAMRTVLSRLVAHLDRVRLARLEEASSCCAPAAEPVPTPRKTRKPWKARRPKRTNPIRAVPTRRALVRSIARRADRTSAASPPPSKPLTAKMTNHRQRLSHVKIVTITKRLAG